jgi:preprotein translocase subunit SecG
MTAILTVLIIITALLLILVVLVQNSKGGGLSSSFASSNQIMGVRKTSDFLEKSTWTLVATLVILCMAYTVTNKSSSPEAKQSISEQKAQEAPAAAAPKPAAKPAPASAPAPAGTPATK